MTDHCRYYQIAGLTIQVEADLPITDRTFGEKFTSFRVDGPAADNIILRHHFALPDLTGRDLGREIYRRPPWAICHSAQGWTYLGIAPEPDDPRLHRVAFFDEGHNRGEIYNQGEAGFIQGNWHSLTLFPSDQILLARLLADRTGCYLHSAGMIVDGQGLLFVGHSEAGKSTTVTQLKDRGQILCDDRNIVRRWPDGWRVHGTWSHGDVPTVSGASAPLRALFFIDKAPENRLVPIAEPREVARLLPFYVVKPLVTAEWWDKTLGILGQIAREVPVYRLLLDKSGAVVRVIDEFLAGQTGH